LVFGAAAVTWVSTSGLVEKLRQIKDADELAAMEKPSNWPTRPWPA
jgi:Xaa-Pro aminopeptidase